MEIEVLERAFTFWKNKDYRKQQMIAVSFSSIELSQPYVFSGLSVVSKFIDKLVFASSEIEYIASLQKDGTPIYSSAFIEVLKRLKYDFTIKFIKEGTLFFPNQPVLFLQGTAIELLFFQELVKNQIAKHIYITTSVEKLQVEIGKKPLLIKNSVDQVNKNDLISACIGGACFASDIVTGSILNIPCVNLSDSSDSLICAVKDIAKRASALFGKQVFIEGYIDRSILEKCYIQNINLKGVCIDLSSFQDKRMDCFFHYIRSKEIWDQNFQLQRYSRNGLYVGDLLSSNVKTEEDRLFDLPLDSLEKQELFFDNLVSNIESIQAKKDRCLNSGKKLPIKYRNVSSSHDYPTLIHPNIVIHEHHEESKKHFA